GIGDTVRFFKGGGPSIPEKYWSAAETSLVTGRSRASGSGDGGVCVIVVVTSRRGARGVSGITRVSVVVCVAGRRAGSRFRFPYTSTVSPDAETVFFSYSPRLNAAIRMGDGVRCRVIRNSPSVRSSTVSPGVTRVSRLG